MQALRSVSFQVEQGEFTAIMGESGSGKTTLLNLIAALDRPTSGECCKQQPPCHQQRKSLPSAGITWALCSRTSTCWTLFPWKTISTCPWYWRERISRNAGASAAIGQPTGDFRILKKFPYEVSGGEKQRAAIARALITKPQLVLADEPTGALDSRTSDSLLHLFSEVNAQGQTILMVTHSVKAACHARRVLFIKDGEVFHELHRGSLSPGEMYQRSADTLTDHHRQCRQGRWSAWLSFYRSWR